MWKKREMDRNSIELSGAFLFAVVVCRVELSVWIFLCLLCDTLNFSIDWSGFDCRYQWGGENKKDIINQKIRYNRKDLTKTVVLLFFYCHITPIKKVRKST